MRPERHNTTLAGRRPERWSACRRSENEEPGCREHSRGSFTLRKSRSMIFQFGFRPTGFPFTWLEVEMYENKGSVGPSHRRVSRSVYDIDPGCSMRVTLPPAAPSLGPELSRVPSMTRLSRNGDAAARWRGRIFPDPFWPKETQKGYGAGARACVAITALKIGPNSERFCGIRY